MPLYNTYMNNLHQVLFLCLLLAHVTTVSDVKPTSELLLLIGGATQIAPQRLPKLVKDEPNFSVVWQYTQDIFKRNCGIGLGELIQAAYQVIEGIRYEFVVTTEFGQLRVKANIRYWTYDLQFQRISFINLKGIDTLSSKMSQTPSFSSISPQNDKAMQNPLFNVALTQAEQDSLKQQCIMRKKMKIQYLQALISSIGPIAGNSNKINSSEIRNQTGSPAISNQTANETIIQNVSSPQFSPPQQNGTLMENIKNQTKSNVSELTNGKISTVILSVSVNNNPQKANLVPSSISASDIVVTGNVPPPKLNVDRQGTTSAPTNIRTNPS